jgi:hypothetical protein
MRKTILIALGAAVALVTAAAAFAAFSASGVSATTATFSTTKVEHLRTGSCTGADSKAFTVTSGHYTGTADFANPAADFDGLLTIDARTVYSTTDGLGWVEGSFKVRNEPSKLYGRFTGTLKGTQLVGWLSATSRGSHARVLGNLSATFVPGTGFTAGAVGSTSSTAVLAILAGPVCPKPKPEPQKRPVHVEGTISAIGDGSTGSAVTVSSKGPSTATCTRDATSPATTGFKVGDRVEMGCSYIGTAWTLRELKMEKHDH